MDPSALRLRRWSLAALVTNVVIVVTGGAVRVTSSGLGCSEWPTCEAGSVVPVPGAEAGWHQLIEFGNRTLTGVVLLAVVGALLAARRATGPGSVERRLGGWLVAGVLGQAVLGGITVRLELHPLTVMAHFLLSMVLIALATLLHRRARHEGRTTVAPELHRLVRAVPVLAALVLVLGTVVTAAGPHAGDPGTPRLDLPIVWVARTHSTAVWLTVGATVAVLVLARRAGVAPVARAATALLVLELAQGGVGYWQYLTGIPPELVLAHLLLACLFWVAAVRLGATVGARPDAAGPPGTQRSVPDTAGVA